MLGKSHFASTTKLPDAGENLMKVLLCHLVARIETASWKLKKRPWHSRGPETQETSMSSRARPWSVRDDCDPEHTKCSPQYLTLASRVVVTPFLITERQSW